MTEENRSGRAPLAGILVRLVVALVVATVVQLDDLPAADPPPEEILFGEWIVLTRLGSYGRAPVHIDPVEAEIVAGSWAPPAEGDIVALPGGKTATWEAAAGGEDGWLSHEALRGGYAFHGISSPSRRVMILEASGHSVAYVNGEPRGGDPYRTGFVRLPVLLREGENSFLFRCSRGSLRARLLPPAKDLALDAADGTLPDIILGEKDALLGALVVVNTLEEGVEVALEAGRPGAPPLRSEAATIAPLTLRKVAFKIPAAAAPAAVAAGGENIDVKGVEIDLRLLRRHGASWTHADGTRLRLRVRNPRENHRRTFVSGIDGSVQYYAVNPARPRGMDAPAPALFLTLHGAAVEATNQANAYAPKSWGHIVAPTNRRPYGFDWEDWGRIDAMEVLAIAGERLGTDPRATYLTGHSMGGHGVWQVAAHHPGRFAAIGPSAAWISFWSYTGAARYEKATPVEAILLRAASPSDTLALARNYAMHGVYILHGEKDDNVPAREAHRMVERLAAFHEDHRFHEQPGAGHWWDGSDALGTDCVDWAPMFDLFARRALPIPGAVRHVEFASASPAISAWCRWAAIEAQTHPLETSRVDLHLDPGLRRFRGRSENVARLALRVDSLEPGPLLVEIDGERIEGIPWPEETRVIRLERGAEGWRAAAPPSPGLKGPHRYGPFKEAFRNRVIFVHGTAGTAEERAWAFAKARFDAETFWYRGNASVELIPDSAFEARAEPDRNVILYGHADSNRAWGPLLGESPLQVRRGSVRVGDRAIEGEELACLFVRPRPGSDTALVAVVCGSGLPGMRLADRLPYFVSGVAYPDWMVLGPEVLTVGSTGVRGAGFFGIDWSVEAGDFAWRDAGGRNGDER
ncbi:MAG: prolyl oligopeptidase family serine peptidase [Planctomycetota bacterium]